MPSRSAEPDAPLADGVEYTGVDLSDLVLEGPLAGGRVWRGRRFVDCTFHDADLRGLVTEQCSFDGCRSGAPTSATRPTGAALSGRAPSSARR